jgi:ribonuclease R
VFLREYIFNINNLQYILNITNISNPTTKTTTLPKTTLQINIMSNRKKKAGKSIKGQKLPPKELKRHIMLLFKRHPKHRFNPKQIIKKLKIDNYSPAVQDVLKGLVKDNQLIDMQDNKYGLNKYTTDNNNVKSYEGIVDKTRSGAAYVCSEELTDDVFITPKNMNSAQDGDKVRVVITRIAKSGRKPEGVITEVLERSSDSFIGSISISSKFAFVIPDGEGSSTDIFVPLRDIKGAKDGDKVVVKVVDWLEGENKSPVGKVSTVLSGKNASDLAMKTILVNNGFDLVFPDDVVAESEELDTTMSEDEIAKRRDMRTVTTFTIDPDTAKDFDDALSIQWLENGHCEIGVHIADVAHYVRPGTALDKEAFFRSTSVYLVDRVSPMLPEKLSNGLCSLRPNEDKFTFSAVFEFDKNDKIVKRWFGRTVTHSNRRFTYEEAQEMIETDEGDFANEIKVMNRLAKKLRVEKFKNGAISFESAEVKFKLDEDANPISVYTKERKDSHMLVEDFMLLANKEVARFMFEKGKEDKNEIPFVYRAHDSPDPGKLADFALFASSFGYTMDMSSPKGITNSFNNLAKDARERNELKVLEPLAIRTMSKAEYTSNNIGHYGLGFEYYTHFTSPIRRYSDVLVHRILAKNLTKITRWKKDELEEQCKHISKQERKAMSSERESVKYKQVQFIKNQIGETFDGIVSGMIDRGLFIEIIENKCEGMIPFSTMSGRYTIQEGRMSAKAVGSDELIKMGDVIKVLVVSADLEKRQIELKMVED